MNNFFKSYKKTNRNIVLHDISNFSYCDVIDILENDDILFLDDCTYHQYDFIKCKKTCLDLKNITCVLPFSTNIFRCPIFDSLINIPTSILHQNYHNNNQKYLNAFMTIQELKELLSFDNVFLALHGHNHKKLSQYSHLQQMILFKNELETSVKKLLDELNLSTDIFVYPYDEIIPGSEVLLKQYGFKYIYPSSNNKRIYIEDLFK
jgi:hypothetical protein